MQAVGLETQPSRVPHVDREKRERVLEAALEDAGRSAVAQQVREADDGFAGRERSKEREVAGRVGDQAEARVAAEAHRLRALRERDAQERRFRRRHHALVPRDANHVLLASLERRRVRIEDDPRLVEAATASRHRALEAPVGPPFELFLSRLLETGPARGRPVGGRQHHEPLGPRRRRPPQPYGALAGRQRVGVGELLVAGVDRPEPAQGLSLPHQALGRDAEGRAELRGALRQPRLHGGPRPLPRVRRHPDGAVAVVPKLQGLAHLEIAAEEVEAQAELFQAHRCGVALHVGDPHRDLAQPLAGAEADPRAGVGDVLEAGADQVGDRRVRRDARELEGPLGVAHAAPQPRRPRGGEGVEDDLHAGGALGPRRVPHLAADRGVAGRDVGDAGLGPLRPRRRRARGRQRQQRHGDGATPGSGHPAGSARRRSGCGHMMARVPSTKVQPPIQIQLTSGLR